MTKHTAEKDAPEFHDEWCPLNGCRCGKCGPCAEFPDCPPRVFSPAVTEEPRRDQ